MSKPDERKRAAPGVTARATSLETRFGILHLGKPLMTIPVRVIVFGQVTEPPGLATDTSVSAHISFRGSEFGTRTRRGEHDNPPGVDAGTFSCEERSSTQHCSRVSVNAIHLV